MHGIGQGSIGQPNSELSSTDAAGHISLPDFPPDDFREMHQCSIARSMSKGLIEPLEMIQIGVDQAPLSLPYPPGDALEPTPIPEPCERV